MKSGAATSVWLIPIILGLLSAVCLTVALVDDSHWDVIASIGLGAVILYAGYRGWVEKA